MRLLFAGTPDAALPSLQALLRSRHEVAAVLTRPDARAGRGRTLRPSPVRATAEAAGIEVLTPSTLRDPDVGDRIRELAPEACPVVAYGLLVPPGLLGVPRHGWVNLHFSVLPAWRGAAPVQHAILAGDEVTGATTFVLDEGLDTGSVLGRLTESIRPRDTAGELLGRLAEAGAELLVATLDALEEGTLVPEPQPVEGVSSAPKLRVEDARIDWNRPAYAVDRQVRACTPDPGAWTTFRGQRLKVHPVETRDDPDPEPSDPDADLPPGTMLVSKDAVRVITGSGTLVLGTVQPHGRQAMPAADWARGVRPEPEDRFGD